MEEFWSVKGNRGGGADGLGRREVKEEERGWILKGLEVSGLWILKSVGGWVVVVMEEVEMDYGY